MGYKVAICEQTEDPKEIKKIMAERKAKIAAELEAKKKLEEEENKILENDPFHFRQMSGIRDDAEQIRRTVFLHINVNYRLGCELSKIS